MTPPNPRVARRQSDALEAHVAQVRALLLSSVGMDLRPTNLSFGTALAVLAAGVMLAVASSARCERLDETPTYDPMTVETICGQLVLIDLRDRTLGSPGVLLLVKRPRDLVSVYVGPAWYYRRERVRLRMQDTVWITGSRVTIGGTPIILAAEIHQGGRTWRLRDASGVSARLP